MAEGYGACLLGKPELLYDMVRQARDRVGDPDFTVSIKIRIHDDIRLVCAHFCVLLMLESIPFSLFLRG